MIPPNAIKSRDYTERRFQAVPAVVGLARDLVDHMAWSWGLDREMRERLTLVTSELATNAVQISRPDELIKIRVWRVPEAVVVSLWDGSPRTPVLRKVELTLAEIDVHPQDGFEFGGWGLGSVVAHCADDTGSYPEQHGPIAGKWVWALFAVEPAG